MEVVSAPKNVKVHLGSLLSLGVEISTPRKDIVWYKGNKKIEKSHPKFDIEAFGMVVHTLNVNDVDETDEGTYSVILDSDGQELCSILVNVLTGS